MENRQKQMPHTSNQRKLRGEPAGVDPRGSIKAKWCGATFCALMLVILVTGCVHHLFPPYFK